jgi:hypothetical protein
MIRSDRRFAATNGLRLWLFTRREAERRGEDGYSVFEADFDRSPAGIVLIMGSGSVNFCFYLWLCLMNPCRLHLLRCPVVSMNQFFVMRWRKGSWASPAGDGSDGIGDRLYEGLDGLENKTVISHQSFYFLWSVGAVASTYIRIEYQICMYHMRVLIQLVSSFEHFCTHVLSCEQHEPMRCLSMFFFDIYFGLLGRRWFFVGSPSDRDMHASNKVTN